jgi:hypothetical protein
MSEKTSHNLLNEYMSLKIANSLLMSGGARIPIGEQYQALYSQHFIFFLTYLYARVSVTLNKLVGFHGKTL